jgi:hypothetical protein
MKLSELDDYDPNVHPGRWKWYLVGAILLVVVAPAVAWGITVAVAPAKGAGDVHRDINTSTNRIQSQELFEQHLADVRSLDQRATVAREAADSAGCKSAGTVLPGDEGQAVPTCRKLWADLTGIQNRCIATLNDYNADARKISKERFRAADLPASLPDPADAENTDCKESAR